MRGDAGGAARYLLASRLRREARGVIALAVIAGLGFGGALATVSVARRTATAHDRFFPSVHAYDYSTGYGPDQAGAVMEEALAGVPGLIEHQQIVGFVVDIEGVRLDQVTFAYGWLDHVGRLEHPTVLEGRLPDDHAAEEVLINGEAAERTGLRAGARLEATLLAFDRTTGELGPVPGHEELRVVGVVRFPDEFVIDGWRAAGVLAVSPAFVQRHWDVRAWGNTWMRLAPGASSVPLQRALGTIGLGFDENRDTERARVWQSIRPLVTVIVVVGLLAWVAIWALAVQALIRRQQRHNEELRVLRAVGAGPRVLRLSAAAAGLVAGAATAAVAAVTAIALSPLGPVGPYRPVDPNRGIAVDVPVVAIGVALILLTFVGVGLFEVVHRPGALARPGAARLPLGGGPLTFRLGVGWAFGPSQAGSRSLIGATAAIAVAAGLIVTSVVFVASLHELGHRPAWYGGLWDVVLRAPYGDVSPEGIQPLLENDPRVDGWTHALLEGGSLDGTPTPIMGLIAGTRGPAWPLVVDGRPPAGPGEILVGADTLRQSGRQVGDRVRMTAQDVESGAAPAWSATIVGTAIFPNVGYRGVDPPRLDRGVAMDGGELRERTSVFASTVALVDLDEGVDAQEFIHSQREVPTRAGSPAGGDWIADLEPVEIDQATSATTAIWLTITGLGLAAAAMLAHGLATAVARRRRDFGVLRALGLTGRQVAVTVAVQGFAAFVVGLAIALVAGAALGRTVWLAFARQLGVLPRATIDPVPMVGIALVGVMAVAVVVLPWARRANRGATAQALRVE